MPTTTSKSLSDAAPTMIGTTTWRHHHGPSTAVSPGQYCKDHGKSHSSSSRCNYFRTFLGFGFGVCGYNTAHPPGYSDSDSRSLLLLPTSTWLLRLLPCHCCLDDYYLDIVTLTTTLQCYFEREEESYKRKTSFNITRLPC